jgi:hypothetical protein
MRCFAEDINQAILPPARARPPRLRGYWPLVVTPSVLSRARLSNAGLRVQRDLLFNGSLIALVISHPRRTVVRT